MVAVGKHANENRHRENTMRCTEHPAFESDYCPSCGTSQTIGANGATTAAPDCHCELGYECIDCARRRIARRNQSVTR